MSGPSSHGGGGTKSRRKPASRAPGSSRPAASGHGAGQHRRRARRRAGARLPAWLIAGAAGALLTLTSCAAMLWWWGRSTDDASVQLRRVEIPSEATDVLAVLAAAGAPQDAALLRLYRAVWHPLADVPLGVHWVNVHLPPQQLFSVLTRARGRSAPRVMLPEGWDAFQMADKLASSGVCDREEFLSAVFASSDECAAASPDDDSAVWASCEGRLYPASYDFFLNTPAKDVVARLVAEADKRQRAVFTEHAGEVARLERELQLSPAHIVTLASIVEKEAANSAELKQVASVFLNRLRDPEFRPARMLQSDPTAAYGCKRNPTLTSCRQFTGKVTAAMLRDGANAYNTYRHAGLPPTPIGNPSTAALVAVLTAPRTDYLFFVSPDGGPHRFSRTLREHEAHLR